MALQSLMTAQCLCLRTPVLAVTFLTHRHYSVHVLYTLTLRWLHMHESASLCVSIKSPFSFCSWLQCLRSSGARSFFPSSPAILFIMCGSPRADLKPLRSGTAPLSHRWTHSLLREQLWLCGQHEKNFSKCFWHASLTLRRLLHSELKVFCGF